MAQKTIITLTDDIDGSEADETLTFGLDGKTYEIDLSAENADELRELLEKFVNAGRRVAGGPGRKASPTLARSNGKAAGPDPKEVREWANSNGFEVNNRGRVPSNVVEAFKAAHA